MEDKEDQPPTHTSCRVVSRAVEERGEDPILEKDGLLDHVHKFVRLVTKKSHTSLSGSGTRKTGKSTLDRMTNVQQM